jgi:tetratricopeptide (TPR) repeat protein
VNEPHHPRARPTAAPEAVISDHGRIYSAGTDQYIVEIGEYHANYALAQAGAGSHHGGPDSVRVPLAAGLVTPVRDRHEPRRTLLSAIDTAAAERVHVLHGTAGCGKTALAQTVFDEAVSTRHVVGLWVNASSAPSFRSGMLAVAQDRGAAQEEVDAARDGRRPAADLVWHYLEASPKPWLLVLDNADDPAILGDGAWLRASPRGTILVTTRHGNAPLWRRPTRHHLDVLDLPDAVRVLSDLDVPADDQDQLEELARRLGCHPLALVLAGTYLGRRLLDPVTVDEFLNRLRHDPGALDEGADPDERDLRRLISSTWQISLDALSDRGLAEATTLIRLLSCYAPDPLPLGLLHRTRLDTARLHQADPPLPGHAADAALQGLLSQSMVSLLDMPGDVGRPTVRSVQVHALLLDTVAARIPLDQREAILRAAATLLADLLAEGRTQGQHLDDQTLRLFTPHALALLQRTTAVHSPVTFQVLGLVRTLRAQTHGRGDYTAAHTLAAAVAAASADSPEALDDQHELASALASLGRFAEAADIHRTVLASREEQFGPDDPRVLDSNHALGVALYGLGAWTEDERYMRRAVEGRARTLGNRHADTILSSACLAEAVGEQHRWEEAETLAQHTFALGEQALGADHLYTLAARHTLAWVLYQCDHLPQADDHIQAALTARTRILGPEHPQTLAALDLRASILLGQGRWAEAEQSARTVLSVRERILGAEHPHTLAMRTELIRILIGAGRYSAAVAQAESNLEACDRVLGPEHPDTQACRAAHQQALIERESER